MNSTIDPELRAIHAAQTEEVRHLCQAIGYGRVMNEAERLWREHESTLGHDASIVPAIGPPRRFLVACMCAEARPTRQGDCEWCCGTGRVTKRVRRAMLDADAKSKS